MYLYTENILKNVYYKNTIINRSSEAVWNIIIILKYLHGLFHRWKMDETNLC